MKASLRRRCARRVATRLTSMLGPGLLCLALALAGLALATAMTASAQVTLIGGLEPRFEWGGQIESDFLYEFDTDTDGGDEFSSWQLALAGEYGGPINESILLGLRVGYRFSDYSFNLDKAPGVPSTYGGSELPRDPWGPLNTFDLAPSTTILIGSQVSFVAAVPIRWSGESGASRNGFVGGISGLLRWQANPHLSLGAGIGVTSQLEGSAETFPIVSLAWRIGEGFTLRSEGSWVQGGRTTLLWGPTEAVRLTLSAGYERNRFRLDDNGNAPDRNGIGEITSVPIEVGVRFAFAERAFFEFRTGLAVAGRFRVETDDGDKLYEEDYDPAPRVAVGLTIPLWP